MTCIVGIIDKDTKDVYIGGDSAGVGGLSIIIRKDPKVFKREPFIFGFTKSFRMGQLLMCDSRFKIREQNECEDDYTYMIDAFIPSVIKLFDEGGYNSIIDNKKTGGEFLVGYKGRLYKIEEDFQVAENLIHYDACGCCDDLALGSLYTSDRLSLLSPIQKIELALETAEMFSAGVAKPFNIVKLEYKK